MLGYSSALIKLLSKGIPEDNLHKHSILLKPKTQWVAKVNNISLEAVKVLYACASPKCRVAIHSVDT